ncbi:MAG: hypothetical protein WC530_01940 [Candidatus Omnitrophota bacterium]|jgi:hypothetical protein
MREIWEKRHSFGAKTSHAAARFHAPQHYRYSQELSSIFRRIKAVSHCEGLYCGYEATCPLAIQKSSGELFSLWELSEINERWNCGYKEDNTQTSIPTAINELFL